MKTKEEIIYDQISTYIKLQYPDVIFMFDLSGIKLPMGLAKKVKNWKSDRGYPDLFIAEPMDEYCGLYIELKATTPFKVNGELKKDSHLQEQQIMLTRLKEKGYKTTFATGFNETKQIIDEYLKGKLNQYLLKKKVGNIISECCQLFGSEKINSSRKAEFVFARQLAQYIIYKKYPYLSLGEIAELTNVESHATIINSSKQIDNYLKGNDFVTTRGIQFNVEKTNKLIKKWLK